MKNKRTHGIYITISAAAIAVAGALLTARGDDKQPADPGLTIAQRLAKYEQFGLEYQEINTAEGIQRSIYYQGQLLKGFVDVQPGGAVFSVQSSAKQGAADVVRTV